MTIRLKVASTAKELDDVFKLRYDVFVTEKGKFFQNSECNSNKARIVDPFDCIPGVSNIIAYNDGIPIATMRVNKDSEIGLPAEMYFDFSNSREQIALECKKKQINLMIGSASMLAIKKEWRKRRCIILAMFKTAMSIGHSVGTSHIITSVSEETQSLYGRLGFKAVGEPQWSESIGDNLVPMLAQFEKTYRWVFKDVIYLPDTSSDELEIFDKKSYSIMTKALNDMERRAVSKKYLQEIT